MASGLFFGEEQEDEPAQSARSRPTLVGVRMSSAETIPQYVYSQGVALPFRTNDVVTDISSHVETIEIQQGDEVEAGETIAHLRPEARTSRLESARRRVEQLETDVDAIRRLVTQGFATESRLRELESQLSDARATLADVREQIEDTAVKSPIFGIVSDLYVNENQSLPAGTAIARIVNNAPLRIMLNVSQREVGAIERGDPAVISFAVDDLASGRVCFVAPAADPETRTFRVEIRVPNSDRSIPANISAEARLRTGEEKAHFVSPAVLTLDDAGRLGLKSVTKDRTVEFIPVRIIRGGRDGFWVTGPPDEFQLISRGQGFVRAGERVRVETEEKESGAGKNGTFRAPLPTAGVQDEKFKDAEDIPEPPPVAELCSGVAANAPPPGSGQVTTQGAVGGTRSVSGSRAEGSPSSPGGTPASGLAEPVTGSGQGAAGGAP